jgi:uncharacterized protein
MVVPLKILKKVILLLFLVFLVSCSKSYVEIIKEVETSLYSNNFESAVPLIRELVTEADSKDKLLYLMEAGVVLHSKGDYPSSNKAFMQADQIADEINVSISKSALSFILSDEESNFLGENFERVMIKLYIALNYLCLNQPENAKRYFQKVEFELKDMKFSDAKYKQNLFARYLDAITSESLGKYNDARVQYKNLLEMYPDKKEILSERYILAFKENDAADLNKFSEGKSSVLSFNKNLKKTELNFEMGELILINQSGKSATKESRGRLVDDPAFLLPLRASIEVSLRTQTAQGLSLTGVMALLGTAENPIPIYKMRENEDEPTATVLINSIPISQLKKYNNYSETAINNYNENYSTLVSKNVASIATKIVVAAVASYTAGQAVSKRNDNNQLLGAVVGFVTGLASGYAVASSIKPDLRCWRTIPSNFQAKRIFLEPGSYEITIQNSRTKITKTVLIEKNKPQFIAVRTF